MPAALAETVWYNEDSVSPLTVSKPASFASGQILLLVLTQHGGATTDITSSTWTTQATFTTGVGSTEIQCKVFSWVFTGTDPSTWDFPYFSGSDVAAGLFRITGANTTPTVVSGSTTFASSTASMASPSVTPTGADDLLLCLLSNTCGGTVLTETDPSGMTDASQTQVSGNFQALAAASLQLASSSATGTKTWTSVGPTGQVALTMSVAVASAAGGTSFTRSVDDVVGNTDAVTAAIPWAYTYGVTIG